MKRILYFSSENWRIIIHWFSSLFLAWNAIVWKKNTVNDCYSINNTVRSSDYNDIANGDKNLDLKQKGWLAYVWAWHKTGFQPFAININT